MYIHTYILYSSRLVYFIDFFTDFLASLFSSKIYKRLYYLFAVRSLFGNQPPEPFAFFCR